MKRKIKYICFAARWFDRINGNTYHSARITRCADGATIAAPLRYGYGGSYRQTALNAMLEAGWIPAKYKDKPGKPGNLYRYERDNGYPIEWTVIDGLKRDAIRNGAA
jgi:hypothetical protein